MSDDGLIPILYVEGQDDLGVISNLLRRHGVDTDRGRRHLKIKPQGSLDSLLTNMPDAIRSATDRPVAFIVDIDIDIQHRWDAVRGRLHTIGVNAPATCPVDCFFANLPDYSSLFGIWLMPDCETDGLRLEHLVQSLMPSDHPLWPLARSSVQRAAAILESANSGIADDERKWKGFGDTARIKAEVRTWLAWQREPGVQLGAAINDHILGADSPQAMAILRWLNRIYGFDELLNV